MNSYHRMEQVNFYLGVLVILLFTLVTLFNILPEILGVFVGVFLSAFVCLKGYIWARKYRNYIVRSMGIVTIGIGLFCLLVMLTGYVYF